MDFSEYVKGNILYVFSEQVDINNLISFLQENKNITELSLIWCMIGNKGAKALADVNLTNLTQLNLSGNNIGNEGVEAFAKSNLTNLTKLDLSANIICVKGAKALADSNLTNLAQLDLSLNKIGNEEAKALAESEKYCEFIDKITRTEFNNEPMDFCKRLKKSWSQARAKSKSNVPKLDESTIRSLFFDLAQHGYKGGIEVLLDDYDKYPFLINSRNEQGHTLSHFYNDDLEMQNFFFKRGMIPEQRRDDWHIARDRQSVHRGSVSKRIKFFTKKLVESTEASEEQLKQAATSYVESIELLEQYQNDPIRLKFLSSTDSEKRSVMEKTLGDNPVPNDKEFIKTVIDKAKDALNTKYLRKNQFGEYDLGYPTEPLQYDYTRDDAKITIPESIGYIKLLIDNFSVPLEEKKELLVTLMEQNPDLVKNKSSKVKEKLGNSVILDKEQFNKEELHGLLNVIDDGKKVDELFKEISDLDIEKIWREQKEFVLLKQIYVASTTYGENESACTPGIWSQIMISINEISSEIVDQYDRYLEEEQKLEAQKNVITEENIKPFLEDLAKNLVQHAESHPELKEALEDFAICNVNIDNPEEITLERQKILAEINKYFYEHIQDDLPNYYGLIPNKDEYKLIINGLSGVKEMKDFAQEPSNQQENITRETEAQIDENSDDEFFDAEDDNESRATIRESDTDEKSKDVNESIFLEENNTPLVLGRLHSETSVVATDQTNGIQNNNQQPSNLNNDAPRSKEKNKLPTVCAFTLAIAGIVSGIAIAVYSGMLAVGIAVGVCCLIAAAIVSYYDRPSNSLENSNVEEFVTNEEHTIV
ncbi:MULTISPECIES: TomO hydrophobic C-terminal domain-containing protein [unclassified Wolbachia]|uniref:TomO hydrophobic C-terminal domain-containing protein n=2 Tax=Wolbachia TaxID=953 RepID=UPI002220F6A6|nr:MULTISPECIES: hypothetical protein [unclassified Wolbachia]